MPEVKSVYAWRKETSIEIWRVCVRYRITCDVNVLLYYYFDFWPNKIYFHNVIIYDMSVNWRSHHRHLWLNFMRKNWICFEPTSLRERNKMIEVEGAKVWASSRVSWWKFYCINIQTSKSSGHNIKARLRSEPLLVPSLSLNDPVSVRATNILTHSISTKWSPLLKTWNLSFKRKCETSLAQCYKAKKTQWLYLHRVFWSRKFELNKVPTINLGKSSAL